MRRLAGLLVGFVLMLAPLGAQARNTEHFFPAEDAKNSEIGHEKLLSIPFYMKG